MAKRERLGVGLALFAIFAIAVAALVLAVISFIEQKDGIQTLKDTTAVLNDTTIVLNNDLLHLQMENMLLQSQVVEISMHTSNETVLQEGTFVWSMGGIRNRYPGQTCNLFGSLVVTGFAISAPGSGY
jgi:predicted PurR-regulated permease PerM